MKVFISADIEGVAGIADWQETLLNSNEGHAFQVQMSKEVAAACIGANEAGTTHIMVKDAHDSGRSIQASYLPQNTTLIRGWTRGPEVMMAGIDHEYVASAMIGYHSGAGMSGNHLAHTLSRRYSSIKINGEVATEFLINAYTSLYYGVPVVLVSGDAELCTHAKTHFPNIETIVTNYCVGQATFAIHPDVAIAQIQEKMIKALSGNIDRHHIQLPKNFEVEIRYHEHGLVHRNSFYPKMSKIDSHTLSFKTNDYFEVMRMLLFI